MESRIKSEKLTGLASLFFIVGMVFLFIYLAHQIIFPFIMAFFIAIVLRPVVVFFNKKLRFPSVIAVLLSVTLSVIVVAGVLFFLSWQLTTFMDDLPQIREHLNHHFQHAQSWLYQTFHISYRDQKDYMTQIREGNMAGGQIISGTVLNSFTGKMFNTVLIFVYAFLMLLYRKLLFNFFLKLVPMSQHRTLQEIMFEIKVVIRGYIVGLLTELCIVAVVTSVGLWFIGVEYFVFLGIMTAILNMIPYIGIILATIISVFIGLISSTNLTPVIWLVIFNSVVHILDANILSPRIVASKVSINALASISGVVIGGTLAGVSGMFLAIPVLAILKVIFDRVDGLKPWGYLLGDDMPKTVNWLMIDGPDISDAQVSDEVTTESTDEKKKKD
ncbi:MAG: AI-2E family transporter [Bacteroidetes bacterium]|nr:AI-2E family transporter [Bacteroidota bacterium]